MPKRTTIILEDDVYRMLVEESIKAYGSVKNISRVVNEILKKALKEGMEKEFHELLSLKKAAHITAKEFEGFRRELSKRFET
jgi:hypothetical protein